MIKINDEIPKFEILTDTGDFKISNYKGKKLLFSFFLEQILLDVPLNRLLLQIYNMNLIN